MRIVVKPQTSEEIARRTRLKRRRSLSMYFVALCEFEETINFLPLNISVPMGVFSSALFADQLCEQDVEASSD